MAEKRKVRDPLELASLLTSEYSTLTGNPRGQVELVLRFMNEDEDFNTAVLYGLCMRWIELHDEVKNEPQPKIRCINLIEQDWENGAKSFVEKLLPRLNGNVDHDKTVLAQAGLLILLKKRWPDLPAKESYKILKPELD